MTHKVKPQNNQCLFMGNSGGLFRSLIIHLHNETGLGTNIFKENTVTSKHATVNVSRVK